MKATFPSNWKIMTIKKYDGTSNPNEHLDVYITQVSLYITDNFVLCWVFSHILEGSTPAVVHRTILLYHRLV